MIDQLIISNKASHDDFDATVKERHISAPAKKVIKETVPFSNITYDFSAMNGELYWEERALEYVFEIVAPTPQEMESKKAAFTSWVMNVMGESIYDPYEPDWHYHATFDSIDFDDDETFEKTTVTVKFSAYPYKIANSLTTYAFTIPANDEKTVTVINDSSHRLTPVLTTDKALTIQKSNAVYTIAAGKYEDDTFRLEPGASILTITNNTGSACTFQVEFYEEVF